ncbi:MAG TPA: anti-sigma factor [Steroidobacteraceae bacterium]|nr:anti-sigma factor [Steroidobacteraceae bacterium]
MEPQKHPEVIDPLAAEYVLGTLRGPARRRFEKWRAHLPQVQDRCRFWEDHLVPLAKDLRPVRPPAHVWRGIRGRLNLTGGVSRFMQTRLVAIAASAVLIIGLASLLYWRSIEPGRITELATISASSGSQLWKVEVYRTSGRMIVRAGQLPTRPANRDYELWALPKGGAPVSLGVLPAEGAAQRALTAAQLRALAGASQIAVTLEQAGGSPTGRPTSTPIYVAPLRIAS